MPCASLTATHPPVRCDFDASQLAVWDTVCYWTAATIAAYDHGNRPAPLRVVLQAPAGAGKSFLAQQIVQRLNSVPRRFGTRVQPAAAFGKPASALPGGVTLSSLFRYGIDPLLKNTNGVLPQESVIALRTRLEDVGVLLIDEMATIPVDVKTLTDGPSPAPRARTA